MVLAVVGRLHERPEPDAGAVAQVGQHKRPAVEKRLPESGLAAVADQRGEIALRLRAVVRDARGAPIGTAGNPNRARTARRGAADARPMPRDRSAERRGGTEWVEQYRNRRGAEHI